MNKRFKLPDNSFVAFLFLVFLRHHPAWFHPHRKTFLKSAVLTMLSSLFVHLTLLLLWAAKEKTREILKKRNPFCFQKSQVIEISIAEVKKRVSFKINEKRIMRSDKRRSCYRNCDVIRSITSSKESWRWRLSGRRRGKSSKRWLRSGCDRWQCRYKPVTRIKQYYYFSLKDPPFFKWGWHSRPSQLKTAIKQTINYFKLCLIILRVPENGIFLTIAIIHKGKPL